MLLPLRMAAGLVILSVIGMMATLIAADFPKYAMSAYGGDIVAGLAPGAAGFLAVQLIVILLASSTALSVLIWRAPKLLWWVSIVLAFFAIGIALIDLFWLPLLAALQSASFLVFELRLKKVSARPGSETSATKP